MTVTPIEGEQGRFFVESSSGREPHTVDLQYQPEPWSKPRCACGCESNFIYGRLCQHMIAAVNYEYAKVTKTTQEDVR